MSSTYWHKQTADTPLFPDMLWSRPENRRHAGKLLIIGGNVHGFAAPAEAYAAANKAGAGSVHVLMPDALARTVGKLFPEAEFAPSTPSGSFAQKALGELLAAASWADGVLLAGNLGKNSETAVLIEKFLEKYTGQLTITGDAADYVLSLPAVLTRPKTFFIFDFAQAQRFVTTIKSPKPLKSDLGMLQIVDLLHELSNSQAWSLTLMHDGTAYAAVDGQVSTTPTDLSPLTTAASASVWLLQNPQKPFEALTCSVL